MPTVEVKKMSRFKRFVLQKYWMFVAYNIAIYPIILPVFLAMNFWSAIRAALEELVDAQYTLPIDRQTFNRLQRRYGLTRKTRLIGNESSADCQGEG